MRTAGGGHLIYIASISGIVPDISGAAYQASKRGMLGLAHAIRVEEKEKGIRTCVICPGLVETEILEKRPVKPSAGDARESAPADGRRRSCAGRRETPGARRCSRNAVDADVSLTLAAD